MLLKRKVSYAKHRGSLRTWTGADTGTEAPLLGLQPEKFISVDFTEHKGGSSEALLPQMWTPETLRVPCHNPQSLSSEALLSQTWTPEVFGFPVSSLPTSSLENIKHALLS